VFLLLLKDLATPVGNNGCEDPYFNLAMRRIVEVIQAKYVFFLITA
jgi:hypothetical protein